MLQVFLGRYIIKIFNNNFVMVDKFLFRNAIILFAGHLKRIAGRYKIIKRYISVPLPAKIPFKH